MKKTLIVPLVSKSTSTVFKCVLKNNIPPHNVSTYLINCVNALSSIDLSEFDDIYFVLNKNIANWCNLEQKISNDMSICFPDLNINPVFIKLPEYTNSPAETIYKTLSIIGWEDRTIFIKDGDNKFSVGKLIFRNSVITASLEKFIRVDPQHKSYIKTDEQGFITNCIEKRIISDKFIAGGYCFRDANLFKEAYEALNIYSDKFYISDIIYWMILNKNEKFLPIEARIFNDFNIERI